LAELAEGPYFLIAGLLDAGSLGCTDATCRLLRELNRMHGGPWHSLGIRVFCGLELDGDGIFEFEGAGGNGLMLGNRKYARVDWKGRYTRFMAEVPTFRTPFAGTEITAVQQADEIAYCRCRLRTDLLESAAGTALPVGTSPTRKWRTGAISSRGGFPTRGQPPGSESAANGVDSTAFSQRQQQGACGSVYMEVEVLTNPDNVSLAVVDFEAGGCSSVTFSPDTGAVIRERKVCESPRKVEGAYIQPLTTTTPGRGFEGSMGLYLHRGHLAFFRRHATSTNDGKHLEMGPWESTGFVTDLAWAEGRRLTPCLAFRNEGTYRVRMICVDACPPVLPEWNAMAYDEMNWSGLDWDAGQDDIPEV
jgi:hypothetical protein